MAAFQARSGRPLAISSAHLDAIVSHARRKKPAECCGILAGDADGRVTRVFEMTNARSSAEEFLMDPTEQFAVFDEMRKAKLEMLAVYHSHPATPARPSPHDIQMAFYPDAAHLIVSLAGDEPVAKAFRIVDGHASEVALQVTAA